MQSRTKGWAAPTSRRRASWWIRIGSGGFALGTRRSLGASAAVKLEPSLEKPATGGCVPLSAMYAWPAMTLAPRVPRPFLLLRSLACVQLVSCRDYTCADRANCPLPDGGVTTGTSSSSTESKSSSVPSTEPGQPVSAPTSSLGSGTGRNPGREPATGGSEHIRRRDSHRSDHPFAAGGLTVDRGRSVYSESPGNGLQVGRGVRVKPLSR